MRKKFLILYWIFNSLFLGISLFLFCFIFSKTSPNFSIIVRKNDFGFNNLIEHSHFPYFLLTVFSLSLINCFLILIFTKKNIFPDLRVFFLLFNFFYSFLVFLLFLQIYFLNL